MITKISSGREAQIRFHFSNGVELSCIWGIGSYTDNHGLNGRPEEFMKNFEDRHLKEWSSTTVEIYSCGDNPNGINEWLIENYGDNPASYVPVEDIPKILRRADK